MAFHALDVPVRVRLCVCVCIVCSLSATMIFVIWTQLGLIKAHLLVFVIYGIHKLHSW